MVMSHNLHNNLGNWCIFPENLLIYQGKLVEAANSLRRRNNSIFTSAKCKFLEIIFTSLVSSSLPNQTFVVEGLHMQAHYHVL